MPGLSMVIIFYPRMITYTPSLDKVLIAPYSFAMHSSIPTGTSLVHVPMRYILQGRHANFLEQAQCMYHVDHSATLLQETFPAKSF